MKITCSPCKLIASMTDSTVTKRVKSDFNTLTNQQFLNKYSITKTVYLKRVIKYGDPYMNAPLAKMGKWLSNRR